MEKQRKNVVLQTRKHHPHKIEKTLERVQDWNGYQRVPEFGKILPKIRAEVNSVKTLKTCVSIQVAPRVRCDPDGRVRRRILLFQSTHPV